MFDSKVRMIEDVEAGKRILNPVLYFLIAWLFYILASVIEYVMTDVVLIQLLGEKAASQPFIYLVTMLFGFIFFALMVFIFVRFVEGRKISSLGLYKEDWFKSLFRGVLWGILLISLAMGIFAMLGLVTIDSPGTQPTGLTALPIILILFIAFLVQGGTEEIVSRGWLLNVVSARYTKIIGVIVSTLFFCSVHLFNAGFNFIVAINIVLFSVFLCIMVFRSNNIWGAIGFHGAWNFAIGNIYGMDVSGVKMGAGSLFDLSVHGSDVLTGGVFGIEGGVLVSLVLIIGIIVESLLATRKKALQNEQQLEAQS